MKSKPLYKQIKSIPFILLLIILCNVIISLSACINSVGKTKILNVTPKNLKERTYQSIEVGENSFQTGTEGSLHWKVKDFKQALLVALADRDKSTNLYDLFYLMVLDIAIFIMVFRVREESVFSDQAILGLNAIAYSVVFYPAIILMSYYFSSFSIETLTNNQFTAQYGALNIPKYLIIAYLIFFMTPFIKKGRSLQQEQDLTI